MNPHSDIRSEEISIKEVVQVHEFSVELIAN